ncbi:hypothetical protein KKF55_01545 [Patescibacteria group bacterium]|nr:hypothetical protein [Patescibacteria group bacterium]
MDTLKHECGITAVVSLQENQENSPQIARRTIELLQENQNRGQHSSGIGLLKKSGEVKIECGEGLVKQVFPLAIKKRMDVTCRKLACVLGIGSVRWATFGRGTKDEMQPWENEHEDPTNHFTFAFNGNVANYQELRKSMEGKMNERTGENYQFKTEVDTELLSHIIAEQLDRGQTLENVLKHMEQVIDGAFNIVLFNANGDFIAYRDHHGFHPLCYAIDNDQIVFSSESSPLSEDELGLRHMAPGQAIMVEGVDRQVRSMQIEEGTPTICSVEFMYFAQESSEIDGVTIYDIRDLLGTELSSLQETDICSDAEVIPIPNSATISAASYAYNNRRKLHNAIARKTRSVRSYIAEDSEVETILKQKFRYVDSHIVSEVILVDDTLIKGATLKRIIAELKKRGAKIIHIKISSPPISYDCPYGVYINAQKTFTRKFGLPVECIYDQKMRMAMANELGAATLEFITPEGLDNAYVKAGGTRGQLCMGCITGDYPTQAGSKYSCS